MGSPSEADVPEWAAMLSTPRRALLAAMEMDTKVQGQKAAAASTPSWRAPDKLAAALARDDSPLKDGVVDEAEVATALAALQEKLRLSTGGGAVPSPPRPPDRGADEPAAAAAADLPAEEEEDLPEEEEEEEEEDDDDDLDEDDAANASRGDAAAAGGGGGGAAAAA